MKSMKRTLCLVLVLVMCLGFAAMAGAVFTDVASIKYNEAVDVLSSLGVIKGYEDGSFKPNGTLTRAEACKIVAYMVGADNISGTPVFDDCKTHWAASNIAYCASEGIVNGVGDNKFDPNGTLTGYAFAKMCLVSLGYSADNEGMTGAGWEIAVAKLVKSTGLSRGIEGFDGTKAITRQEAAQLALNVLQADMVQYPGGVNISAGDVTISVETKAEKTGNVFAEEYFPRLRKYANSSDVIGRPAVTWTNRNQEIGTYPQTAEKTIVVPAGNTKRAGRLIEDARLKLASTVVLEPNGVIFNPNAVPEGGGVMELFTDEDGLVDTVVWYLYEIAQVTKVTDLKSSDALARRGASVRYTLSNSHATLTYVDNLDEEVSGTQAIGSWKKDDHICMVISPSGELVEFAPANEVRGAITSYTATTYTIGGTRYNFGYFYDDTAGINQNVDFRDGDYRLYLDPNDFILKSEVISGSVTANLDDIVYVVAAPTQGINNQGDPLYYVKTVSMDGEYRVIQTTVEPTEINLSYTNFYIMGTRSGQATFTRPTPTTKLTNGLVTDIDNSSNIYFALEELYNVDIKAGTKSFDGDISGLKIYIGSDTKYIFEKGPRTAAYDSIVRTISGFAVVAKEGKNYVAKAIIVPNSTYVETVDSNVLYTAGGYKVSTNINGYDYNAYDLDGEKITITLPDDTFLNEGFYNYTVDKNGVYSITAVNTGSGGGNGWYEFINREFSSYNRLLSVYGLFDDATVSSDVVILDLTGTGDINSVADICAKSDATGDLLISGRQVVMIVVYSYHD